MAWARLFPLNRKKVLHHLPPVPPTPKLAKSQEKPSLRLPLTTSSPPDREVLRQSNETFKAKVSHGEPLSSPTRQYALDLVKATERLSAQVAILRSENKEKEGILGNRRKHQSGKRTVIKGHFILSTEEIYEKVVEAEKETARKKARKKQPAHPVHRTQPSRKRKRAATPSEDEEDEEKDEEYFEDEESDWGETIVVGGC